MIDKNKEIHRGIVDDRYYFLSTFVFLIFLSRFVYFANVNVIASILLLLLLSLYLNRKISLDNMGIVAVIQMISIVGMIGVYDYYSAGHNRLNFFLNFATGFSGGLSVYGLYFGVRENK